MGKGPTFNEPCGGCGAKYRSERCIGCMHEHPMSNPVSVGDDLVTRLDSHMGKADMGDVLRDCRLAASRITDLEAQLKAAREALSDIKDAAKSFRDESGDDVAGQVILRVDAALNPKAPS